MSEQPSTEATISAIKQLSLLCDLVGFQDWIGRKTKYGDKPGPEPWYHTRRYLATYAPETQLGDVTRLFEGVGAKDEVEAAMFIAVNMKHVP